MARFTKLRVLQAGAEPNCANRIPQAVITVALGKSGFASPFTLAFERPRSSNIEQKAGRKQKAGRNMRKRYLVSLITAGLVQVGLTQVVAFDGLEKAMDPTTFEKAGLHKLSDAERAALDDFVRDYVLGKQKEAATAAAADAVDRAVREQKVRPPEIIESRIVGTFKGYGVRTIFTLANGQVWKPTNAEILSHRPLESPTVIIFRDMFGYKMFVEGASVVRVKRVR